MKNESIIAYQINKSIHLYRLLPEFEHVIELNGEKIG